MGLHLELSAHCKILAVTAAAGCRSVASVYGNAWTTHRLWYATNRNALCKGMWLNCASAGLVSTGTE